METKRTEEKFLVLLSLGLLLFQSKKDKRIKINAAGTQGTFLVNIMEEEI